MWRGRVVCSVPSNWVSLANSSRRGSCLRTCTHTLRLNNKGGSNPAVRSTELDSSADNASGSCQVMLRPPHGWLWALQTRQQTPGKTRAAGDRHRAHTVPQLWGSQQPLLRITNYAIITHFLNDFASVIVLQQHIGISNLQQSAATALPVLGCPR